MSPKHIDDHKHTLISRYCIESGHVPPSIKPDYQAFTRVIDGQTIKIQIWDSPFDNKYPAIMQSFYTRSSGVAIIYDMGNNESFSDVEMKWIPLYKKHSPLMLRPSIIVIGIKPEHSSPVIDSIDIESLTNRYGVSHYICDENDDNNQDLVTALDALINNNVSEFRSDHDENTSNYDQHFDYDFEGAQSKPKKSCSIQ